MCTGDGTYCELHIAYAVSVHTCVCKALGLILFFYFVAFLYVVYVRCATSLHYHYGPTLFTAEGIKSCSSAVLPSVPTSKCTFASYICFCTYSCIATCILPKLLTDMHRNNVNHQQEVQVRLVTHIHNVKRKCNSASKQSMYVLLQHHTLQ